MAVVEAIATCYLETDASSVAFSSIPQTYEHLQVRMSVADPDEASTWAYQYIRINGDTGAYYTNYRMQADGGATTTTQANAGQTYMWTPYLASRKRNGSFSTYSSWVVDILDYVNPNKSTTISWYMNNSTQATRSYLALGMGVWDDTSNDPVDEITLPSDVGGGSLLWLRGSTFTLYGWNSA